MPVPPGTLLLYKDRPVLIARCGRLRHQLRIEGIRLERHVNPYPSNVILFFNQGDIQPFSLKEKGKMLDVCLRIFAEWNAPVRAVLIKGDSGEEPRVLPVEELLPLLVDKTV